MTARLAPICLAYVLSFGALGAITPYLAWQLREAGLSGMVLTLALIASPAIRLVAGPVWAVVADRLRISGQLLRLGAGLATVGAVVLCLGPGAALLGAILFALGRAPLDALLEGVTLTALGPDASGYGRVRLWGSFGFLAAALGTGWSMEHDGPSPLQVCAALSGLCALLTVALPTPERFRPAPVLPALRAVAGIPQVPWFLLACTLHFFSHTGATFFMPAHIASLGGAASWTGVGVALGVTVEIAIMARSRALFARLSPDKVILLSAVVAIPRWLGTALATSAVQVALLQTLHGVTFGAFWVAAVARMAAFSPLEVRTSSNALLAAAIAVGSLLGNLAGPWFVEHADTRDLFYAMAGASLLSVPLAWRAAGGAHG